MEYLTIFPQSLSLEEIYYSEYITLCWWKVWTAPTCLQFMTRIVLKLSLSSYRKYFIAISSLSVILFLVDFCITSIEFAVYFLIFVLTGPQTVFLEAWILCWIEFGFKMPFVHFVTTFCEFFLTSLLLYYTFYLNMRLNLPQAIILKVLQFSSMHKPTSGKPSPCTSISYKSTYTQIIVHWFY